MNTIRPMFAVQVLGMTEESILPWRILVEVGRKAGRTFPQPDLLIAATALEHDLIVVTRNVKDFTGLGLTIFNPWDNSSRRDFALHRDRKLYHPKRAMNRAVSIPVALPDASLSAGVKLLSVSSSIARHDFL